MCMSLVGLVRSSVTHSYEVVEDIPLINGLELALHSPQIPPYIMNALLNLAEFMVSH